MIFTGLSSKLNWLHENISSMDLLDIQRSYTKSWLENGKQTKLPKSTAKMLALDIMYSVMRHENWCITELFKNVAVESVRSEYGIPRTVIMKTLEGFIRRSDRLRRTKQRTDREFLFHVLVLISSSKSDSNLVHEVGLGIEILTKLRSTVRTIESNSKFTDSAHFLPEVDHMYSELILELSEELQQHPWKLESHRLKFYLSDAPEPWLTLLNEKNNGWLLRVLAECGKEGEFRTASWEKKVRDVSPIFSSEKDQLSASALLIYLESKKIVYCVAEVSRRKKSPSKGQLWRLTNLGEKLTATVFATEFMIQDQFDELFISKLGGEWQAAVIKTLDDSKLAVLLKVLASDSPLHPEAFRPAFQRLASDVDHETLADVLEYRAKRGKTPGIRAAACLASTCISSADRLKQLLQDIAEADQSIFVQDSALQALQVHESSTSALGTVGLDFS